MNAKFKNFTSLMESINDEIQERNEEIKWYKFKLKQLNTRPKTTLH